jgi:shikimate 5-dehydrogenase
MSQPALAPGFGSLLTNPLDESTGRVKWMSGLLGEHPSQYSRSPALWNAAYSELGLDAAYAPFDVPPDRLAAFVRAVRESPGLLGINVTVPYKQTLLPYLDELDSLATAIGATNCVVRTRDGRLVGTNTDAIGALACLIRERLDTPPFFSDLEGATVLLVGAGGAGRAVGSVLVPRLGNDGRLLLANRTRATADEVAAAADPTGGHVQVIAEDQIGDVVARAHLLVNASMRGQAGFFQRSDGQVTCLEPYSPLGPASPAWIDPRAFNDDASRWRAWYLASLDDLRENERAASFVLAKARPDARFFDLVYAPPEPTFLRTARWAGHATLNGADMILHQAVAGFLIIAGPLLGDSPQAFEQRVEAAMRSA